MTEAVNPYSTDGLGGQTLEDQRLGLSAQLVVAYEQNADFDHIARLNRKIARVTLAIELPGEPSRFYEPDQHTSGISLVGALATIASSYIRA